MRIFLLALCTVTPSIGVAALAAQTAPPDVWLKADIDAVDASIRRACDGVIDLDQSADAYLTLNYRLGESLRRRFASEPAAQLACSRAMLYREETIAREGYLMSLGDSWHKGAVAVLVRMLEEQPATSSAASLLGLMELAEYPRIEPKRAAAVLATSVRGGVRDPEALRACAILNWEVEADQQSRECVRVALTTGRDSTWHFLHLARTAFAVGDSSGGTAAFTAALGVARDSIDRDAIGWHLRWFLNEDELATWAELPDPVRPGWILNQLALRDVRDAREPGTRLAEHFSRLESIERMFRVSTPLRDRYRRFVAAVGENRLGWSVVTKFAEPGVVPAAPWRNFKSSHHEYDDRATVWMRWGEPEDRVQWSGTATVGMASGTDSPSNTLCQRNSAFASYLLNDCKPGGTHGNTREAWQYELDAGRLLLHFEGEQFDASAEATRLVGGVLGSYLCDVDVERCGLSANAGNPFMEPLNVETVDELAHRDAAHIDYAVSRDDNSVHSDERLRLVSEASRVWQTGNDGELLVVPYASVARDFRRASDGAVDTASFQLTLRQWDGASGEWRSTQVDRRLRLPTQLADDAKVTGHLVVPSSAATRAWSLVISQDPGALGRAWRDDLPPLGQGNLAISDLILGSASQGESWTSPLGNEVPLGPLGAYDRREPVAIFWQLQSDRERDVTVTVALFRLANTSRETPVLEVSNSGQIAAGLTEWQRNLGVEQLEGGSYRIEVSISGAEDGPVVKRSAKLYLW